MDDKYGVYHTRNPSKQTQEDIEQALKGFAAKQNSQRRQYYSHNIQHISPLKNLSPNRIYSMGYIGQRKRKSYKTGWTYQTPCVMLTIEGKDEVKDVNGGCRFAGTRLFIVCNRLLVQRSSFCPRGLYPRDALNIEMYVRNPERAICTPIAAIKSHMIFEITRVISLPRKRFRGSMN